MTLPHRGRSGSMRVSMIAQTALGRLATCEVPSGCGVRPHRALSSMVGVQHVSTSAHLLLKVVSDKRTQSQPCVPAPPQNDMMHGRDDERGCVFLNRQQISPAASVPEFSSRGHGDGTPHDLLFAGFVSGPSRTCQRAPAVPRPRFHHRRAGARRCW